MTVDDLLARAREHLTARLVFAEPYEKDGVTVIAAARVLGGGGGGGGRDGGGRSGDGAGLGLLARPVGAFVVEGGRVRWYPVVDLTSLTATVGALVVAGLLATRHRRRR